MAVIKAGLLVFWGAGGPSLVHLCPVTGGPPSASMLLLP